MAIQAFLFGEAVVHAFEGRIDFTGATPVKVLLLDNTIAPNQDSWKYLDSITSEIIGDGYTLGGKEITNRSVNYDGSKVVLTGNNVTWEGSTITARYAVLYYATGTATTSPLIGYIDFETDYISNDSDFAIAWDDQGIVNINITQQA